MPRGGSRPGSGGRPTWIHGKTKVIRVPVALADQVLEIARMLDEGRPLEDVTGSKTIDLSGISIHQSSKGMFVYLHDFLRVGFKIRPIALLDRLRKDVDRRKVPK